jgi:DoxX-like family
MTQTFSNEGPPQAHSTRSDRATSSKQLWAGRIVTGLTTLFMLMDGVMKIVKPAPVLEASAQMGYPVATLTGIGLALITCTLIYIIPRTSIFGAILLTGYLGGAVASQVRAGSGWFELVFPVLFAALVWCGLWLRDHRLRRILALAAEAPEGA